MHTRLFNLILIMLFIHYHSYIAATSVIHGSASPFVFYIDPETGSDANDGHSPNRAWRSLDKVNSFTFQPGDSLLFRDGSSLTGQLVPKGAGIEGKPIVISSFGRGEKPKIAGNGVLPAAVYLYNTEYWEILNLDISNKGTERLANLNGIEIEGKDFGIIHSIVLKNLTVHDVYGSLVKKEGGGSGIFVQNQGSEVITTFDGLLIEGCTLQRCERNGITFNGYWSRKDWHPNLHVVIRYDTLEEIPGDGIVPIGCDGALIEHNLMHNGTRLLPANEAAAGIWPWSCDNTVVQYNEVSGHKAPWDGQGFDSDWNSNNTVIQYNYSHDNEGGFLLICNDGSVKDPYSAGNRGTIVRYNVSINDGIRTQLTRSGIFSPVLHIAGPVKNSQIYNNVFFVPDKQSDSMDHTLINSTNWNGFSDSTSFFNNIFYSQCIMDFKWGQSSNNRFSNNLYNGNYLNMPMDVSKIVTDPKFFLLPSDREGRKGFETLKCFRLQKDSPCINRGRRIVFASIKDFFGNPVSTDHNPSIGIYEFNP